MGEYAIRNSDGAEIKIGTCESMYYLRYDDRRAVTAKPGNVDPVADAESIRFRLPWPDEDDVLPGEYGVYNRGERLVRKVILPGVDHWGNERCTYEDFSDLSTCDDPGSMQLHHEASGLLLNVPCYHGHKLPDVVAPMRAFWNGKGYALELTQVRPADGKLYPVVRCRFCDHAWRYQWSEILPFVLDAKLRERLEAYAQIREGVAA